MLDPSKQADGISKALHLTQRPSSSHTHSHRDTQKAGVCVPGRKLNIVQTGFRSLNNKENQKQRGGRDARPKTFCPHQAQSQSVCCAERQQQLPGRSVWGDDVMWLPESCFFLYWATIKWCFRVMPWSVWCFLYNADLLSIRRNVLCVGMLSVFSPCTVLSSS